MEGGEPRWGREMPGPGYPIEQRVFNVAVGRA
jgi:hypothetical protein